MNYFGLRQKYCCAKLAMSSTSSKDNGSRAITNLVLLAAIPQARLAQVIHDRLPAHLVLVKVRDVVVFALERLARGIFAFTRNFANALGIFENETDINPGWARDVARVRLPERWGQVIQDGGEWS